MNSLILKKLSALGCNFAIQEEGHIADPEKVILEALQYFWLDKKIFTMLLALLKYRIHHLINTKRLYNLASTISLEQKAVLRVVARKVYRYSGDTRFAELEKKLNKRNIKIKNGPDKYCENFFIERKGLDKDFAKVGLRVADFFEEQPEKKLKTLKKIYHENQWLKLRAIGGPDYRVDTLFLVQSGLASTQGEVSQWLQCNKSSVSRIWSSIKNIEDLVLAI